MVMYPNPYIWFWFGYNLVWQNNRPCTPLVVIKLGFTTNFFNFHVVVNHICFNVNIIGYFLKCTSSTSIHEFQILKAFSIELHAHAPKIKEVYWYPPKHYWIKCNEETALNWLFRLGCMQRFI
jgi:hypothetical protein